MELGWLQKSKPHWNARFGFKQSIINFPYYWHIFIILSHYCSAYPYFTKTRVRGKTLFGIQLQTRTYPCFTQLHDLFYVNNVKVVPSCIYDRGKSVILKIISEVMIRN
jgi:hypothetical protein